MTDNRFIVFVLPAETRFIYISVHLPKTSDTLTETKSCPHTFYQITSGLFSVMKLNFVSMMTNTGMLDFKIHETGCLTNYAAMCRCYCMHFACLCFS